MRRIALLSSLALLFAVGLHAQKVDKEGKAWLDRATEPAEMNVTGMWFSEDWENVALLQAQGSREVAGNNAEYKIKGVVSGNKVFLLFSDPKGKVQYSAELQVVGEDALNGTYSKRLMKKSPGKDKMQMTKTSDAVAQAVTEDPAATVVVYRKTKFGARAVEPQIDLDKRTLAWADNGRYFSFKVSPGAHTISSAHESEIATIDAVAGEIYYVEVHMKSGAWTASGAVELVTEEKWQEDRRKLKPLAPKNVLVESIVLLEPISEQ